MSPRSEAVIRSALWAAYGDALGYMTELADEAKVRRRTGASRVQRLQDWTRDLPGRPPKSVRFPAGTYSDDTQLRLASGRAIRADGRFNVAAFAKVELPTWANYALGAGISSKEAAFSLSKASSQWYSNFFQTKRADYRNGGGNGAAMRIQPHVWASPSGAEPALLLRDVIRDAVCTHGHPRGILGAAFHAISLHFTLVEGRSPSANDFHHLAGYLEGCWDIIVADPDLRLFWLPQAEKDGGHATREGFLRVIGELHDDIDELRSLGNRRNGLYRDGLSRLGLFEANARGSGTKCALVASWLTWLYEDRDPHEAIVEAANTLGSDTDTIATMAGALLGPHAKERPPETLQDQDYLVREAERLSSVASRSASESFGYPDLRSYKPPKSAVDAIYADGAGYVVSGLGRAVPKSPFLTEGDKTGDLRWLELETGQTILAHIRPTPKMASDAGQNLFEAPRKIADERRLQNAARAPVPTPLSSGQGTRPPSVEQLANVVINGGHDPRELGLAIFKLCEGPDEHYLERAVSLAAIVGRSYRKAKVSR